MFDRESPAVSSRREREPARLAEAEDWSKRFQQSDRELRALAATLELVTALDQHQDLTSAAEVAAQLICDAFASRRVVMFWRQSSSSQIRVIADTCRTENGSDPRFAVAAGEEAASQTKRFHWSRSEKADESNASGDRVGLLAVAQFADAIRAGTIMGVPFHQHGDNPRGAVVVIDAAKRTEGSWLEVMSDPVGAKLTSIEALQPTALESKCRSIVAWASNSRRSRVATVTAIVLGILLMPLRYRVSSEIEIQPTERRFVAVPFDGPLKSAHVRPGDTVREKQLLAEIDPREIEYELAGIQAELQRSLQEKKGLLADHDVAGSQLADWEARRLENETDLLTLRRENLEIRSPIAGVVVRGDWEESEGMPMTRGETLFEVAPLDELVVEIAIPEEDIHHVRAGMPVEFFVNAMPNRTLQGKIVRVHPSAELRDHQNVYVAELWLHNPEGIYRPGMRGRASIVSDRHTLVWNVFHKPWHSLWRVVGW